MAIALIAAYGTDSGSGNNTSTLTTPSFHPQVGEIIVVKAATWDTAQQMQTPVDGGLLSYTLRKSATGSTRCWVGIWTAEVLTDPGTMTISSTPTANCEHSMVVERWSGAKLASTPAVNGSPDIEPGGGGAPSSPITTVGTNSVVSFANTDWAARSTVGRVYRLSATEDYIYDRSATTDTVHYYAWAPVASPGTNNIGMTIPSNQFWAIAGIELQEAAGGVGTENADGTLATSVTRTASAASNKSGSGSSTITAHLAAAASVVKPINGSRAVAFTGTAVADIGILASLDLTSGLTATAQSTRTISGSLGITVSRIAVAQGAKDINSSLTIVTTQTAADSASKPLAASPTVTFGASAAIDLQGLKTIAGELELSVAPSGDLSVSRSTSAALMMTATPSATAAKQKDISGVLVITEAGATTDTLINDISGALTVSGSTAYATQSLKAVLGVLGIDVAIDASAESINIALPPDYVVTKTHPVYTIFSKAQSEITIVSIRADDVVT